MPKPAPKRGSPVLIAKQSLLHVLRFRRSREQDGSHYILSMIAKQSLLHAEFPVEFFYSSAGVNKFLLACIKWVTL